MPHNLAKVHEARQAKERLWNVIPVGYGRDFNTLLKYIEYLEDLTRHEHL